MEHCGSDSTVCPAPDSLPAAADYKVYFKDKGGKLHQLEAAKATQVVQAAARGDQYVDVDNKCTTLRWQHGDYRVLHASCSRCDLKKMKHMNPRTGEEEDIVIEVPWNASLMKDIVNKGTDKSLRRQILIMALHRIRRAPVLQKILATKGLVNCKLRESPYIQSGHKPFENFVTSLLSFAAGPRSDLYGHIIETASWNDASSPKGVSYQALESAGIHIVFHGTNHEVMDAILQQGLRPGPLHYFGISYEVSLGYTKRKTILSAASEGWKVMVFMLLSQREFNWGQATTSQINDNELPIAEVTVPSY